MNFSWKMEQEESMQVKNFLKTKGVSRSLLAKIKFQGGKIRVNGCIENAVFYLQKNDVVEITIPDEGEHETLLLDPTAIEIVYEDDHYLVVNKPVNVPSIPAQYYPNGTMANRVKNYYTAQNYSNRVIHVVTRLDRDTSGLMLFAKHGFAHALMDKEIRKKKVIKKYQALIAGKHAVLPEHGVIEKPIGRDMSSLIKRQIVEHGKQAITEYWYLQQGTDCSLVDIQLHTGRTHQIRVHFESIGCPLVGDELYGGKMDLSIKRQALHCGELHFCHPFTQKEVSLCQALPTDMRQIVEKM